jgi:hypothetical protein
MPPYVLAFLIGVIAGLRSLTAPAAVSWAARLGWLKLENTWLAFLGYAASPYILSVLALVELIADQAAEDAQPEGPARFCSSTGDRGTLRRRLRLSQPVSAGRFAGWCSWQYRRDSGRLRRPENSGRGFQLRSRANGSLRS